MCCTVPCKSTAAIYILAFLWSHCCALFLATDLVSFVNIWKLPVVWPLSQVVEVAIGKLSAFSGDLHSETRGYTIGSLTVHQSKSLEVSWSKHGGNLHRKGVCLERSLQRQRRFLLPNKFHKCINFTIKACKSWDGVQLSIKPWDRLADLQVKLTYHISVVRGAGALRGDTHTETGQAAIFVCLAEIKGSRLTGGAVWTRHIHLLKLQPVNLCKNRVSKQMLCCYMVQSPCTGTHHYCRIRYLFGHSYSSSLEQKQQIIKLLKASPFF